MSETYLTLSVGGLPPFSSRGCRQELAPIKNAEAHRTINGELVTTVSSHHHKYRTKIKGKDQLPVALDSLWKGQSINVGCIQYLWQEPAGNEVTLNRNPVKGSVMAVNQEKREVKVISVEGRNVKLENPGFVGYRPHLEMKLIDFGYETEEWGDGDITWYMTLEEI